MYNNIRRKLIKAIIMISQGRDERDGLTILHLFEMFPDVQAARK